MKKVALLLFLLLFLCPASRAQWRAGVLGGAARNFYSIDTHYMSDVRYKGQWGALFGFALQYDFIDWLAARAELGFDAKDYRMYRTADVVSDTDLYYANTYLQLPVMASFRFGGKTLKGFMNLGCYGAYWLSSHRRGQYYNGFTSQTAAIDEDVAFDSTRDRRWEWGLCGGTGVEYRFAAHWAAQAELRGYYSLTSTQQDYMRLKDPKYHTTVGLQAALFYLF